MKNIEANDVTLYIHKSEYKDIDIKVLSFIESFVQKYMKQVYVKSFNGGIDKLSSEAWAQIMGDLQCVYEAKWLDKSTVYQDMVDRTLPRHNPMDDPLFKAVSEVMLKPK
jgi:hypothetical protein